MADQNTIALIKSLRERTGAGMMDCKKALEENGMDVEKAIDYLREKGIAKAAKRADRTAAEGLTKVKVCDKCGKVGMVEVNCETDFVARSDKFIELTDGCLKFVMQNEPATLEEAVAGTAQLFNDASVALGEKLAFKRFSVTMPAEGQGVGAYIHMGGKISTYVVLEKADAELANGLAMHIAANNPTYITLADVPADIRDREQSIALAEIAADPKLASKPDMAKAKIAQGKVDKRLSESCLLFQAYLMDGSKTIAQVLEEKHNKVVSFVRYQVGEGAEKAA